MVVQLRLIDPLLSKPPPYHAIRYKIPNHTCHTVVGKEMEEIARFVSDDLHTSCHQMGSSPLTIKKRFRDPKGQRYAYAVYEKNIGA